MVSEVSVCNEALAYLGVASIESLDENSQPARTCKRFYATTRDSYLTKHNWSFAVQNKTLTEIDLPDEYSNYFAYGYSYPSRCLEVLGVKDESSKRDRVFEIKVQTVSLAGDRRIILTNVNPAVAEIILQVTDPLLFSAPFAEALGLYLAYKMAMPLTRKFQIQQNALKDYLLADQQAKEADFQTQLREAPPFKWKESRKFNAYYSKDY